MKTNEQTPNETQQSPRWVKGIAHAIESATEDIKDEEQRNQRRLALLKEVRAALLFKEKVDQLAEADNISCAAHSIALYMMAVDESIFTDFGNEETNAAIENEILLDIITNKTK